MRRGAWVLPVLVLLLAPQHALAFDGIWEGVIRFDKSERPFDERTEARTRIELTGSVVHVSVYDDRKLVEVMAGKFTIRQDENNFVLSAVDSGDAFPHREWAEALSYTATMQWDGSLLVEYARVGQMTHDEILSISVSNFAARGEGVLKQMKN